MPRPAYVQDLVSDESDCSQEEYERLMGSAIRSIVALQESAGLDVITDGEWWRKSYIGVIAELAHGFLGGEGGNQRRRDSVDHLQYRYSSDGNR